MSMSDNKLLELKQQILKTKARVSELKGKKELLEKSLKKDHGCKSITEANTKLEALKKAVEDLKDVKDKMITRLEKEFKL